MRSRAVITAVTLGALAGVAIPASHAAASSCNGDKQCLWNDVNYNGTFSWRHAYSGIYNISGSNNDKTSAWKNNSYTAGSLHEHANLGGWCYTMKPRTQVYWIGAYYNDKASSWNTNRGC